MSQIHIADGQSDNILDYITAKNIISDTHKKSLENTLETYNFITFADKSFSQFLEKRNRIIIPDEDDSLVEFVIFEAHKYRDTEGHKAQVYAHASYLELKKAGVIYPSTFTGTASQHGGRALNGTGWEVGNVESSRTITINFSNHTNPYEYLKRIAREFELELDFRVEHNGTKITRRIVDLVERIGTWRGREVSFGKDLDGIRRVEKQDIVTALLGLGPEDENGNRLEVLVEDEEALQRWGRRDEHGNLQHLIGVHEIQSERTEMTEAEAIQYTRTALNKRINTQVTYETTIVDLENVPGMENKKIRFGDTIKIKDEKFNPPLYLEARVFELERSIKFKGKKDIKLGDFIEYTEEQVHDIFNQLRKEIRARITRSEMVEHTYSKIEIDNKDQYVFDEGKSFAEAVGIEAEDNAKQFAVDEDAKVRTDAKDYANTAKSEAISAAEQDAQTKADLAQQSAQAYAEAKAEAERVLAEAYADGIVSAEEQARIDQANANLATAKSHAELKASEAEQAAKEYAELKASEAEDNAKSYADDKSAEALSEALAQSVAQDAYDTKMAQIADELSEKAGITYVDGKLQIVDGAIADLNAEIETKADGSTVYTIAEVDNMINNTVSLTQYTTDINGIVSDLSSQGTQIGQNTEAIGLKADQTTVNALTGTVNSHSAQLLTMADEISAKVSADYVQTAIDDVEIGGRNLLRDSGSMKSDTSYKLATYYYGNEPLKAGERYTISIKYRLGENRNSIKLYSSGGYTMLLSFTNEDLDNNGVATRTFTMWYSAGRPAEIFPYVDFYQFPNDSNLGASTIEWVKIEKGNKATDWTPAPEDVEAEISSLSAELSVQAGLIEAKADSSTVNALGTRISNAESSIDAIEGEITNKVSLTEFNSLSGTVSTLSSTVSQQATQISSKVDDGQVRSIFTQEAGSFTFDASQVNFTGHIFGQGATFNGNISGAHISGSSFSSSSYHSNNQINQSVIVNNGIMLFEQRDPSGILQRYSDYTASGISAIDIFNISVSSLCHNNCEIESIVSQGSNSNGHWIRYSSGFQICWNPIMSATGSMQASGAIYRSEAQTWNFPQPFSSSPAISGSVRATGRWLSSGATSNTSATLIQYSSVSGNLFGMDVIAIGRWK